MKSSIPAARAAERLRQIIAEVDAIKDEFQQAARSGHWRRKPAAGKAGAALAAHAHTVTQ